MNSAEERRKLAQVFVQHPLAHVLPGMGFPEGDDIRDAARVKEQSRGTRFPFLRRIAELPEKADETPPRDLRWQGRHRSESETSVLGNASTSVFGQFVHVWS